MNRLDDFLTRTRDKGGPDFNSWAETLVYVCRNPRLDIKHCQRSILEFMGEALDWKEMEATEACETLRAIGYDSSLSLFDIVAKAREAVKPHQYDALREE
jgi:hypothetical protein